MKKLVNFHFWLLLALCLFGHSVISFAADEQAGASCVDELALRGFYEKFSLIEKEKEALRNKLSVCTAGQNKQEQTPLGIPLSQQEGRELRLLEARVAQLEEENKALRDKLNVAVEPHSATTVPENQPSLPDNKSEDDAIDKSTILPEPEKGEKESLILQKPKPDNGLAAVSPSSEIPEEKAEEPDTAASPAEPSLDFDHSTSGSSVLPDGSAPDGTPGSQQQKESENLGFIETGSGSEEELDIQWKAPRSFLRQEVSSGTSSLDQKSAHSSRACEDDFNTFESALASNDVPPEDKKVISDLVSSIRSLLISYSSSKFRSVLPLETACTNEEIAAYISSSLNDISSSLEGAVSTQEKIQILYQEKIKIETLDRKKLYN